jgi:transposase-like protein
VPEWHRQEVFHNYLKERDHLMKNLDGPAVRLVDELDGGEIDGLPGEVQLALAGIADAAREGLLALSVTAGLAVLAEMMELDRAELCGPKDVKDPGREHVRNGTTATSVVLGGRRVAIRRPRVAATDGSTEPTLPSFAAAAQADLLTEVATERMLAGISTRKYTRANEPMGQATEQTSSGESKSAVSRRFVRGTQRTLDELIHRPLDEVEVAVLMVDGVDFAGQTCVVAMVITTDGTKIPVGLRHGDTENATLVTALLADLVERGLDYSGGLLVIIDGAKALAAAVRKVFGARALIGRCQLHKARNVEDHLPKAERARIRRRLVAAFNHPDPDQGLTNARRLAAEVERTHPDAAGSIREGLEEMFTVARLGVTGSLAKTLRTTNPIESMISIARTTTGNVKRWRDGEMRRRWCAAGMLEAEKSFRRVKGHTQMPALVAQLRAHAARVDEAERETVTPQRHTGQDSIAA